jgi:FAD/FMN-containing dehydrogenase
MPHPSRRTVLASALATAAVATLPRRPRAETGIVLDDASHLNPTPVARHVVISDGDAGTIERLRTELKAAAAEGRPVAIGAARHSMGGQSLARGGTALTFETPTCMPDTTAGTYRALAGARWHDVISALDAVGRSPAVMQLNNDFGVASTFSVNAHGWAVPHGPFGSTVRSLRLMLADGSIVTCSRDENAELFRHAMGGYGSA